MQNAADNLTENEESWPELAVVIPAYKAEARVGSVIAAIPTFVRHILVVDDASPDSTGDCAKATGDPRVHVIRHDKNQGVGGATLTGYAQALELGAEIVIKMDADGQMDPAALPRLLTPLLEGQADYCKGNRFLHARELTKMPLTRRIGNLGLAFLTKLASGYWNVFDPTNGYTAIHRSALRRLNLSSIAHRYFFESSMLVELNLVGAVTRDVAIPAIYGEERSSLSNAKSLFSFPPRLLRSFLRRVWVQHFVRDFGLCTLFGVSGFALLLFGLCFGVYHWIYYAGVLGQGTPIGTVMLSVLPIILGVQFLLQALLLDIQASPREVLQIRDRKLDLNQARAKRAAELLLDIERSERSFRVAPMTKASRPAEQATESPEAAKSLDPQD